MTLAGLIGQVGCLTLAIIAVALVAGLWLDNHFQTRPLITMVLVLGSIPVTLYLMFRVVLAMAPKLQFPVAKMTVDEEKEKLEGGGERAEDPEA